MIILVTGVSGSGKSTLGRALADALGFDFIEGDDHHPRENVDKMRRGRPLDEADRRPWLDSLNAELRRAQAAGRDVVLACSALRAAHRDRLTEGVADPVLVFLDGDPAVIRHRMRERRDHFMPAELLDDQLATLEPPQDAIRVDVALTTAEQVARVRHRLDGGDKR